MITPIESYWNSQSDTLRDVQHSLTPDHRHYEPLSDQHPLLQKSYNEPARHRKSSSPANLPRVSNSTPSAHRQDSPSLRGAKYGVIPPVKPKTAFTASPSVPAVSDHNDSWGEDSEGEDPYPQYSYPMVMYPMIVAPHPHMTSRRSKNKHKGNHGNNSKKKVHYRNTPTFLNSRENTKHEPAWGDDSFIHGHSNRVDPFDPRSNSVLARYQYSYVPPTNGTLNGVQETDFPAQFVDNLIGECFDDAIPDLLMEILSERQPMPPDHPLYAPSFYYCEDLLNKEVPRLVREVVHDSTRGQSKSRSSTKYGSHNTSEKYLDGIVHDAIATEIDSVVKETTQELVEEHLEYTAVYNSIFEMATDIIKDMGPSLVEESLYDILLEDLIDEDLILPVVEENSEEVAVEVLTHYSDKVRQRDIREIKKQSGSKLEDSLCLDHLLAQIARQGELWTEGEHANKLLDELMLRTVITEYFGVGEKKRRTIDNKPVRKYYEKVVTDVAADVLLEELSRNLDEDMADLDEYERGVENTHAPYQMPKDLKQWFDAR